MSSSFTFRMEDSNQVIAVCMLLAAISCILRARECIPVHGYESCACYFPGVNDTWKYVNLLPLKINSSSPRFTSMTEKDWYISYSPCGEFSEFVGENSTRTISCSKISVARWTNSSAHQCDSLGDEANGKFEMDNQDEFVKSNLTLKFNKTRGGFTETGSHMLSSDEVSDGAPNPWKHTTSLGDGGLSSQSSSDNVAWSTVSISNAGSRPMLPTKERMKYFGVKLSDPTQLYTVPTWPLFGNLRVITPSVICLTDTFTYSSLMSSSTGTLISLASRRLS
ncbi:uncharacterized protein LOC111345940 isoform X1 [Stylophora pistillata]|uniref:uncharacterized protein LOC111345940 isoform X1 n=1 Tax=Stylophora pistillata TaxID=50429 RepID=UPI000C03A428|nr:uncharacterized protein LOC111345940 isoform X1 [Stylophora pistillata]